MSAATSPRWPADVPVHPAAELFPLLAGEDYAQLSEDIVVNGLVHPIVRTPAEEILDGRNRYLACTQAGITPRYVVHEGDPWTFVISTNLHRRHLTDTQRAIIAGRLADRPPGRASEKASAEAVSDPAPTRSDAANLLQVSRSAVERARRVDRNGTPALKALTEAGDVPLSTADRIASTLPPEQQEDFVTKVRSGLPVSEAEKSLPAATTTPKTHSSMDAPPPARPRTDTGSSDQHDTPPTTSPTSGSKRARTRPAFDATIITADALAKLALDMTGLELALKPVTAIDSRATPEQRATWERAATKGIQALTRLRKLLKSTTAEEKS